MNERASDIRLVAGFMLLAAAAGAVGMFYLNGLRFDLAGELEQVDFARGLIFALFGAIPGLFGWGVLAGISEIIVILDEQAEPADEEAHA